MTALIAEEGIRALAGGLPAVVRDPHDVAGRSAALYGAYLAGTAFAVAGASLHHKICHVLGGAFDLPHARTHAIVLPYVLAFNAPYAPEAVTRIAAALGRPDPVEALRDLGAKLGVPAGLRQLGLREADLDTVRGDILALAPADNPRPVTAEGVRTLLHAAWAGTDPAGEAA